MIRHGTAHRTAAFILTAITSAAFAAPATAHAAAGPTAVSAPAPNPHRNRHDQPDRDTLMTATASRNHQPAATSTPRIQRALFAVTALLLGFTPATLTFALNPHTADDIGLNAVPIPAWGFIAVWLVIYPGMGLAAWHLWHQRTHNNPDYARVPLAVLTAGFLQTTTFWFNDSLRGIAGMDATGVVLSATTVWVISRYSSAAARWLLPWAIWMPITLTIKLAVLTGII
jgi:tryptophan-rich sensory protein